MTPASDYRAILFDMDGVLIDSFLMWLHVMNDVARESGHPEISEAALAEAYGQGIEEDLRVYYPRLTRDALTAAYARTFPRHAHRIEINPQAHQVLAWLAEHGIGRAVVTNSQSDALDDLLASVGLRGSFDAVVGSREGLAEKPAPDLLLHALAALDVRPSDALMVGDTAYDRVAAEAAGVAYRHYVLRSGESLASSLGIVAEPGRGT